jgi:hypothetical protein
MIRSLAEPISIAPEADTRARTWNSAPVMPLAPEIAVGHQRGEQHGDADEHGDQHAEAVHHDGVGDVGVRAVIARTSNHCQMEMPKAPPEMITLPMVLTRTRSGRLTSEARASRTAPPRRS